MDDNPIRSSLSFRSAFALVQMSDLLQEAEEEGVVRYDVETSYLMSLMCNVTPARFKKVFSRKKNCSTFSQAWLAVSPINVTGAFSILIPSYRHTVALLASHMSPYDHT